MLNVNCEHSRKGLHNRQDNCGAADVPIADFGIWIADWKTLVLLNPHSAIGINLIFGLFS